jgi:hypothetical protein
MNYPPTNPEAPEGSPVSGGPWRTENVFISLPDFLISNYKIPAPNPKAFIRLRRSIRFNWKSGNQEREKKGSPVPWRSEAGQTPNNQRPTTNAQQPTTNEDAGASGLNPEP